MGIDLLEESVKDLSLKELKGLVSEGGLSTAGCVDKADIRARAKEALERLKVPGAKLGPIAEKAIAAGKPFEEQAEEEAKEETARKAKEMEEKRQATYSSAAEREAKEKAEKEKREQAARQKRLEAEEADKQAKKAAAELERQAAEKEAKKVQDAAKFFDAIQAGNVELSSSLLKEFGPSCKDKEGNSPLHFAAKKGLVQLAEDILAAGASINARNDLKQTPLHVAVLANKVEAVKILLSSIGNDGSLADVEATDENDQTPLRYAELNKRTDIEGVLREAAVKLAAARKAAAERAEAAKAAEAQAAADAEVAQRLVNKSVMISGLKARPDANGLVGYVLNVTATGRCTVAIKKPDGSMEQLALKPANLSEHVEVS